MKSQPTCLFLLALFMGACGSTLPPPELSGRLAGLSLGEPVQHENLTVIPVYSEKSGTHDELVPLETALEKKMLEIKEVEDGEVSRVILHNHSDKKIFILSGQVITGCKQDRIIAGDRIIEPNQRNIDLDVFCVEAGRWTAESDGFYTKKNMGTAGMREKAQRKTGSEQSEIWGEISEKNARLDVATDTNAYQDAYDQEKIKVSLARFQERLTGAVDARAVGVIIGVGGKLKSVDVFDNVNLLRHYWPSLLTSSSLEAIAGGDKGALSRADAQRLLAAAGDKEFKKENQNDATRSAAYLDDTINASELESGGKRVHFSFFPVDKQQLRERERNNQLINREFEINENNLNLRQMDR